MKESKENQILIIKDREQQRDEMIVEQQMNFRRSFYVHQINNKLKEAGATPQQQQAILEVFIQQRYNASEKLLIDINSGNELCKYKKQVHQLQQAYNVKQEYFKAKQKECCSILQIIELKYTALKVIHIQYKPKEGSPNPRYQLSSFKLFKVIFDNHQLTQVTIKGIQILQFQIFITLLNSLQNNKLLEPPKEQTSWLRNFNPSKDIKLSIHAKISFKIYQKQQTLSLLNDLTFFNRMFPWFSDPTLFVKLGELTEINNWSCTLQKIWAQIGSIRKISLQIQSISGKQSYISSQSAPIIRSVLFGGMESLTQITKLSFKEIYFHPQLDINAFLAMEEIISTIFENNPIAHLKLDHCNYFPIISKMHLQSVHFDWQYFRKDSFNFMNEITQSRSLRSIYCFGSYQQWTIDEQLIHQLQFLHVLRCRQIFLDLVSSQPLSNIKYLSIYQSSIGRKENFAQIFPKLANLTALWLNYIDASHELICSIPSIHLSELHLLNQGLVEIDNKWPNLRRIRLSFCLKISQNVWNICKFSKLVQVQVDSSILGAGKKVLHYLKKRGIKIVY